jgi:hypothetical protein
MGRARAEVQQSALDCPVATAALRLPKFNKGAYEKIGDLAAATFFGLTAISLAAGGRQGRDY